MRPLHFDLPASSPSPRLARLTRHLAARLEDFGPGGPQVVDCDQQAGRVTVRIPGYNSSDIVEGLRLFGIFTCTESELIQFYLNPDHTFEELDHLWGCLLQLLE